MNPPHSGHPSSGLLCSPILPLLCFLFFFLFSFSLLCISLSPPLLWLPPPVLSLTCWLRLDVVLNIKQVICLCLQPLGENNGSKSYKWHWFVIHLHTLYYVSLSLSPGTAGFNAYFSSMWTYMCNLNMSFKWHYSADVTPSFLMGRLFNDFGTWIQGPVWETLDKHFLFSPYWPPYSCQCRRFN